MDKPHHPHTDTPEKRTGLREIVDNMTDAELDTELSKGMLYDDFDESDIEAICKRLNEEIRVEQQHKRRGLHFAAAAAAIIAVVLLSGGVFMYHMRQTYAGYDELLGRNISIGTLRGEKTSTTLPDGTKVLMSPESKLTYTLASFCSHERRIWFNGEAHFNVSKDSHSPFILASDDFEIKVLGTVFSVLSRDHKECVEVYLEEGSIELKSAMTSNTKILKPGETAILNRSTGQIEVDNGATGRNYSVGNATLYFTSSPLTDIAGELGIYYGLEFDFAPGMENIRFTGSLPTDNLEQTLYILQQTLGINMRQNDNHITISRK